MPPPQSVINRSIQYPYLSLIHICGRVQRLHAAGQFLRILPLREGAEKLLYRLDALHRLEPESQIQRFGDVSRHRRRHRAGLGVGVGDEALCRRDGAQPADHPVEHRREAVFVGVAALERGGGIPVSYTHLGGKLTSSPEAPLGRGAVCEAD